MTDTNSIVPFSISTNLTLNTRLLELDDQFERAARQNIAEALDGDDGYTDRERTAMIKFEKLKLIGGLGLAEVMLRGKVLDEIERGALHTILPGGFQTLEDAAKAQGIAVSTLTVIRDLTRVIFPYFTEHLGVNLAEAWDNIGSSNFREILPVLKVLITGQASTSPQVTEAVATLTANSAATLRTQADLAGDHDPIDPALITRGAIEELYQIGQLPNREVRARIRPTHTPAVVGARTDIDGRHYFIIEAQNDDQLLMIQRKMGTSLEVTNVEPAELRRTALFRTLSGS